MLEDYISKEIKPSSHDCPCNECKIEIKKGEVTIKVLSDVYNNQRYSYKRYHPNCFLKAVLKIAGIPKKGGFIKGFSMAANLIETNK